MSTLAELLTVKGEEEITQLLLNKAQAEGLPVTSWQPGAVPRTTLAVTAAGLVDLFEGRAQLAQGGYLKDAAGAWLALYSESAYDEKPSPAVFTEGICVLSDDAGDGPYTIAPGDLWAMSDGGRLFVNTTGGTLAASGTLPLTFKAEASGALYNVGIGAINKIVGGAIAGVSVYNPDSGAGTWITVQGQDPQDDSSLKEVCRSKWSAQGLGLNDEAWRYWAKKADSTVTRAEVETNPGGVPGLVGITIAGVAGAVGSGVVAAVQAFCDEKKTSTTAVLVTSAVNKVVTLVGTIYVEAAYLSSAQAAGLAALTAYQGEVAIGGTVYRSRLVCELRDPEGVRNVALATPAGEDTILAANEVVTFNTAGLSWVAV